MQDRICFNREAVSTPSVHLGLLKSAKLAQFIPVISGLNLKSTPVIALKQL
jgi:hypothetical protein